MSCVLRRRYLLGRLALSATCHFHKSAAPSVYREIARLPCSVSWLHCTVLENTRPVKAEASKRVQTGKTGCNCKLGSISVPCCGIFCRRALLSPPTKCVNVHGTYCRRYIMRPTHIAAGASICRRSRHIIIVGSRQSIYARRQNMPQHTASCGRYLQVSLRCWHSNGLSPCESAKRQKPISQRTAQPVLALSRCPVATSG